jgi:hypothetical protein
MFRIGFSFAGFAQGLFAKLPTFNYNAWIYGATWVHCIARVGLLWVIVSGAASYVLRAEQPENVQSPAAQACQAKVAGTRGLSRTALHTRTSRNHEAGLMAQAQDLRKFVHIDRHHRNGSVRTVPSAVESELEVRWKRFAVEGTCK